MEERTRTERTIDYIQERIRYIDLYLYGETDNDGEIFALDYPDMHPEKVQLETEGNTLRKILGMLKGA